MMMAVAGISVLIGIFLGMMITRSVTGPVAEAMASLRDIAQGNLSKSINVSSKDEIGQLMQSMKEMRDELYRIVDLMRTLRAAQARRHTREEIPFFTGRRRELAEIVTSWAGPKT